MALVSASQGIGDALGLPAGAFVTEHADWHVLYLASAGFAAVALLLARRCVAESPVRAPGRFNLVGAAGFWNILRDCRLRGDGVRHAMHGVARPHNLALTG